MALHFFFSIYLIFIFVNTDYERSRIAFGSCNKHFLDQPLWPTILSRNPDLWIWTGDIVYHDRPNIPCFRAFYDFVNPFNQTTKRFHCHRIGFGPYEHGYDQNYNEQLQHKEYQKLLQSAKVIGIWDDHDFGMNDGGTHNPHKQKAKDALMKFLSIPKDDPIRKRDGMYSFHSFSFGERSKIIIDVYLMDVRWFSDPKNNILFGEEQWNWLESKMKDRALTNEANISLFVSGVQILPYYRGYYSEAWSGKSNADRTRFLEAILNLNVTNPILISGDVHFGEYNKYVCKNSKTDEYKSLYEVTSSGMTHTWAHSYSIYANFLKKIADGLNPDGATISQTDVLNFGEMEVVYDENIKHIYLRLLGVDGLLMELDLMNEKYLKMNQEEKNVIEKHLNDDHMNGEDWTCVGYNEPNFWVSHLFVMMIIGLIGLGMLTFLFVISGGGCCCFCFCCARPCRKRTKIKKS